MRVVKAGLYTLLICTGLAAADIHGVVVIEKKLTRRTVTNAASAYQRGISVAPADAALARNEGDGVSDALAFEREHTAIYIEGPSAPPTPLTGIAGQIGQAHRQFEPDFLVIPVGAVVSFPNFDPIFHNVFSLSKPKSFDLGNYPLGQSRTVTFTHPGIVFVNCHLHPNMAASLVVSPTPWCTRSGAAGDFQLTGVPPGKYTVVAWHKSAGFFRQTILVGEDHAPEVRFVVPFGDLLPAVASR